jgi:hypothetical protein
MFKRMLSMSLGLAALLVVLGIAGYLISQGQQGHGRPATAGENTNQGPGGADNVATVADQGKDHPGSANVIQGPSGDKSKGNDAPAQGPGHGPKEIAAVPAIKPRPEGIEDAWFLVLHQEDGKVLFAVNETILAQSSHKMVFKDNRRSTYYRGKLLLDIPVTFREDRNPKVLVLRGFVPEDDRDAIYELVGDTLRICWLPESIKLPTDFSANQGSGQALAVYARASIPRIAYPVKDIGRKARIVGRDWYEDINRDKDSRLFPSEETRRLAGASAWGNWRPTVGDVGEVHAILDNGGRTAYLLKVGDYYVLLDTKGVELLP